MTDTPLVSIQCGSCGVWHAIPKAMHDNCVEEGGHWHCPNGHQRGYNQGRRAREAVIRERDQLKQKVAQLADEAAEARSAKDKAKKLLSRHRKRAKAGTCPCCNRTFSNMASHMKTQHPEFESNVVNLRKGA